MKIAILTDCTGVGGGMTFIRRFIAAHPGDETRLFLSDDGECTAAKVDAWGADLVHVNHLKALLQLLRNPFRRPKGRVVFVVHGVHLRKYDFLPKTPRNVLARRLRLALERWLYARCDGLVALNADDVEYLRRVHGVKVPVRLEPNTVDPVDASARNPSSSSTAANSSMRTNVRRSPRPTSPVVDSPSMVAPLSRFSMCIAVLSNLGVSHDGLFSSVKSSFQNRLLRSPRLSTNSALRLTRSPDASFTNRKNQSAR